MMMIRFLSHQTATVQLSDKQNTEKFTNMTRTGPFSRIVHWITQLWRIVWISFTRTEAVSTN